MTIEQQQTEHAGNSPVPLAAMEEKSSRLATHGTGDAWEEDTDTYSQVPYSVDDEQTNTDYVPSDAEDDLISDNESEGSFNSPRDQQAPSWALNEELDAATAGVSALGVIPE